MTDARVVGFVYSSVPFRMLYWIILDHNGCIIVSNAWPVSTGVLMRLFSVVAILQKKVAIQIL